MTPFSPEEKRPWSLVILTWIIDRLRARFPNWCALPHADHVDPYASAMLDHYNWLYNLLFPRFFSKIHFEVPYRNELLEAAKEGTVIYVSKSTGQLEYHYYNYLLRVFGLPLAAFTNSFTSKRWMRWKRFRETLLTQCELIKRCGAIPDPITSGYLEELVVKGQSVLITLSPSTLEDHALFLSSSRRPLISIIAATRKSSRPLFLVPLEFIWDKRPERTKKRIIDLLFGEKENPGTIRKTVLFWRHYKNRALVRIGKPISLSTEMRFDDTASDDMKATLLRARLLEAIRIERRTTTGPPIRPRSWFIERSLSDEHLGNELTAIAIERHVSIDDIWMLASRYIDEIAADIDYTVIELISRFLHWFFAKLYERLIIDPVQIQELKHLAATRPVIFVPNHKSHVDYLLLSHLLHAHNMTVPHIAAGKNLSFWPLGVILRRGGAYFIRRTFRDNQVYRAVLQTYLRCLLKEGYSQEFFIEGERSRSGKLAPPRMGMLSMLLRAADVAKIDNLTFIPVSITYDRVIEQKSYIHELEGATKKRESRMDILKLTKYLRGRKHRYGNIHVRFGRPISAREAEGDHRARVGLLADSICYEMNHGIIATPAAIVAATLLSFDQRGIPLDQFRERARFYLHYLRHKGVTIAERLTAECDRAIDESLAHMVQGHLITFHPDAITPFYSITEERRLALDYIKNGVIHFFASVGIIAALLLRHKRGDILRTADLVDPFLFGRQLFSYEFRFSTRRPAHEHIHHVLTHLEMIGVLQTAQGGEIVVIPGAEEKLQMYRNLLENFLESYRIVFTFTLRSFLPLEERPLIAEIRKFGEGMVMLGEIHRHESLSRWNIAHAVRSFISLGIISEEQKDMTKGRKLLTPNPQILKNLQGKLERLL